MLQHVSRGFLGFETCAKFTMISFVPKVTLIETAF
jgi:hypothetical protein